MSNNRITPFVKRMRTSGGTIYVFSSATEDIGLNINEKNNDVRISHFALLNIPSIQNPSNINENRFNLYAIDGALEYANAGDIKDGRVLIAESFQNYALNFEANLLNQATYDATLQRTVSERVFWKWLKETGAIRWANPSNGYWMEAEDSDGSLGYNTVVKYVGLVSAGNVRSDSFGTYNETYIMVPTSHGQMEAYFEQTEDANYYHGMEIGGLGENILGRETWLQPHPDGLSYRGFYDFVDSSTQVGSNPYLLYYDASPGWWYTAEGREPLQKKTYMTDTSAYLTTGIYDVSLKIEGPSTVEFKRSLVDCMGLVLDLNKLRTIYGDDNLTFDSMATGDNAINDRFEFNAVLVYYSVYNAVQDTVLATNLLGILFLDAPSGTSQLISGDGILIPSLEKIQSTTGGFGTSYALRLNIKTDNMLDDTGAIIADDATSGIFEAENWNLAFAELGKAVNILTRNNSVLNYISDQYVTLQSNQTQMLNSLTALQAQVNDIAVDIQGTENAIAMFSAGDDPLVESYPEPSANMTSITYRGQTIDLVAGTTINSMYLARPAATGRMQLADADSSSLVPAIAINPSTGNYTAGNTYPFLLEGIIRNSAWTWTPGKQLYLSASNQLTQTAPSIATHCVQVLGVALARDIIYFNPSMDFIVVK